MERGRTDISSFTKRTRLADRPAEEGVNVGHACDFFALVIGAEFLVETISDVAPVFETVSGDVNAGIEGFVAVRTTGLEAAEFGGAFVKEAMDLGAGAVHGYLDFGLCFKLHGV